MAKAITIRRQGERYFARTDGAEREIKSSHGNAFQVLTPEGNVANPSRAIRPADPLWWLLADGESITITEFDLIQS